MSTALKELNERFVYTYDDVRFGRSENWAILTNKSGPLRGDCEDYSLTLLWMLKGKSYWRFWFALIFGSAEIWYCKVNGEGHAVMRYKGMWIDNISRKWVSSFPEYEVLRKFSTFEIFWKMKRFFYAKR